jgi:hypothetical protein
MPTLWPRMSTSVHPFLAPIRVQGWVQAGNGVELSAASGPRFWTRLRRDAQGMAKTRPVLHEGVPCDRAAHLRAQPDSDARQIARSFWHHADRGKRAAGEAGTCERQGLASRVDQTGTRYCSQAEVVPRLAGRPATRVGGYGRLDKAVR